MGEAGGRSDGGGDRNPNRAASATNWELGGGGGGICGAWIRINGVGSVRIERGCVVGIDTETAGPVAIVGRQRWVDQVEWADW